MRLRHIRLRHTGTPAVVFALVMAAALTACSGGDKQAEAKKLTAAEQLATALTLADASCSAAVSFLASACLSPPLQAVSAAAITRANTTAGVPVCLRRMCRSRMGARYPAAGHRSRRPAQRRTNACLLYTSPS